MKIKNYLENKKDKTMIIRIISTLSMDKIIIISNYLGSVVIKIYHEDKKDNLLSNYYLNLSKDKPLSFFYQIYLFII